MGNDNETKRMTLVTTLCPESRGWKYIRVKYAGLFRVSKLASSAGAVKSDALRSIMRRKLYPQRQRRRRAEIFREQRILSSNAVVFSFRLHGRHRPYRVLTYVVIHRSDFLQLSVDETTEHVGLFGDGTRYRCGQADDNLNHQ